MYAILVTISIPSSSSASSTMIATCHGCIPMVRKLSDLPLGQPAHALAKLLCVKNKFSTDLVAGVLPNGDEVFCFRQTGRIGL